MLIFCVAFNLQKDPPSPRCDGYWYSCLQFHSDFWTRRDQPSIHGIALGNPEEGRVYQEVITNTDLVWGALERAAKLDKQRRLLSGGAKYTLAGNASSCVLEYRGIGVLIANRTKRFFLSIVSRRVPGLCHPLVYWVRFLESNECRVQEGVEFPPLPPTPWRYLQGVVIKHRDSFACYVMCVLKTCINQPLFN